MCEFEEIRNEFFFCLSIIEKKLEHAKQKRVFIYKLWIATRAKENKSRAKSSIS